jgi:hypothetical protein
MKYTVICKELTWSTVEYEVEANSEEEAKHKIEYGDGNLIFDDFDALIDQKIVSIKPKNEN